MEVAQTTELREPRNERRTLQILAGVLVAGALALVFDLWPWLLLAIWTASLTAPLARGLFHKLGGRSRAAAVITLGLLMALLTPLGAGIAVLVPDMLDLAARAKSAESGSKSLIELVSKRDQPEGKQAPGEGDTAPEAEPKPEPKAKPAEGLSTKPDELVDMAQQHGQKAISIARPIAGALGAFAMGVFVYFVGVYAALLHGDAAYAWLREQLPLSGASTDRLRDAYQETGRGLLYSVGLTALLQGGLATVAYVSLSVPRALAIGLLTVITSLIPAIGPFLVWGPVALGLFLAGHPTKAAILAGLGVVVVAPADNLLRPLLAKRGKLDLHPFLVFFSMLGAISLIGGWGLVVGPLVFRMAREALDMLREHCVAKAAVERSA